MFTAEQLDLQALHRVRERLVRQRTGIINQIRAFLLERGIAVRQGLRFLRAELPTILAKRSDVLSPRMLRIVADLSGDWRRLDERIEGVSSEIRRAGEHCVPARSASMVSSARGWARTTSLAARGIGSSPRTRRTRRPVGSWSGASERSNSARL